MFRHILTAIASVFRRQVVTPQHVPTPAAVPERGHRWHAPRITQSLAVYRHHRKVRMRIQRRSRQINRRVA